MDEFPLQPRVLASPLAALALAASYLVPALPVRAQAPTAELGAAASSVHTVAAREFERLASFDDSSRSRMELLRRNISRYFVVNLMPTDPDEFRRVIGTAERMSRRAGAEIYRAAERLAKQSGATTIERRHLEPVLSRFLPFRPTGYKELAFFPEVARPIVLEEIDLEAFHDTAFCWQVLVYIAEAEIQPDPEALPMDKEAVGLMAEAVNAYGFLLLRIGGIHARREFAPYLQTHHLRAAGKTVGQGGADLAPEEAATIGGGNSRPWFSDVTEASGVDFRHVSSDWISRFRRYGHIAPTFSGGGASAGHLDDDAHVDLVICGGQGCSVFRNLGDGSFEDITTTSGVAVDGEARMAVLADFDNDGRSDVFITYARDTNRLFRNLGRGQFRDLTSGSGLERDGDISGPAVAFDYDNDGLLDLYVGNFGNYLAGEHPWSPNASTNGMPNRLYHNVGGFNFEEVTETAGVGNTGWTQALSHIDYDLDGDQDLYIANDFGANDLLVNNGDGTFSSAGISSGSDDAFHGMNVAFTDLNRDRHADIFITNIWFWNPTREEVEETNSLLLSSVADDGSVRFRRVEDQEFLRHDTGWSWGGVFFDADNDGDEDLYVVNGFTDYLTFIQYRPSPNYPGELYAINNGSEPNWFFRSDGDLPIHHVPDSGLELPGVNSRSATPLDYDGDGDLDLVVTTFHSRTRVYRNDGAPTENHWLSVMLVGDPSRGSNRDAIGAQVLGTGARDLYVWRARNGGEAYLSVSSPELELGLGTQTTIDLEVIWPGGERQTFGAVAADRRVRLRQGSSEIEELPKW